MERIESLAQRVDAYVDEVWEDVVEDIDRLVRIRSVEDLEAAAPGMPWGPASHEALVTGLEMASRLGLDAHECEGYLGYADLVGASETQIATIAHTDIVPEGLGWTVNPFEVTRREGYLLGRGVIDDKGPFVLSLYAAHFFAREAERTGCPLPYTLRCIVGSNEETSMKDLDWYLDHFDAPAFCFSPDADFPLICGEKGIFQGVFRSKPGLAGPGRGIVELDGGTVPNAIPGLASALVRRDQAGFLMTRCTPGIESDEVADGVRVTSHGIGGHAAFPQGTDNAIGKLVRLMLARTADVEESFQGEPDLLTFLQLVELLTRTSDGSALGLSASDDVFGELTFNAGVVSTLEDGSLTITVDIRYPTSIDLETIVATLEEIGWRHGCAFEQITAKNPFYMDPSLPPIQILLQTYQEYAESTAEPVVIGGGTYARRFPCACAFGPNDPSEPNPDWVGMEHGPDEGVSEEVLRRALKIYIVSIARLMELDFA